MKLSDFFKASGEESFSDFYNCEKDSDSFITFAGNERFLTIANENPGVVAIVGNDSLQQWGAVSDKVYIAVERPRNEFFTAFNVAVKKYGYKVIVDDYRSDGVKIGKNTIIEPGVFLGRDVEVGSNCIIKAGSHIGDYTTIHDNVVIGSDGLQAFCSTDSGRQVNVQHAGGVSIGKGVTILQGVNVSKSLYRDFTTIGDEAMLSIGVSVGHGSKVGMRTKISGKSLVGGSCVIGDDVWIGPGSTLSDSISVADRANIRIGSVVIENVALGGDVSGNFALQHTKQLKNYLLRKRN